MADPVRVGSIQALDEFRGHLLRFEDDVRLALAQADGEIGRTIDWLKIDRLTYWKSEINRREEKLTQARSALNRAQAFVTDTSAKSFVDEKKAVQRCKRAVDEGRQKLAATKKWIVLMEQSFSRYKGQAQGLASFVAGDLPAARGRLDRMATILTDYANMQAPGEGPASASSSADASAPTGSATSRAAGGGASTPVDDGSGDELKRLARRTPTRRERQRAPMLEDRLDRPEGEEALITDRAVGAVRAAFESSPELRDPPPLLDRVIIDPSWREADAVLLHRQEKPALGDSGWFIGDASAEVSPPAAALRAVRLSEVTEVYPELDELLSLARGSTLVLQNGAISLNAASDGTSIFPALDRGGGGGTMGRPQEE